VDDTVTQSVDGRVTHSDEESLQLGVDHGFDGGGGHGGPIVQGGDQLLCMSKRRRTVPSATTTRKVFLRLSNAKRFSLLNRASDTSGNLRIGSLSRKVPMPGCYLYEPDAHRTLKASWGGTRRG
jgi:hypothetical protein